MKHVLITGANGQLGNEMRLLAAKYPDFVYFLRMWPNWTFAMKKLLRLTLTNMK